MAKSNLVMTDAELTILCLVAERPQFGYEIQQTIDERGLREWLTIGFASIYYILNKLESQTLVSSEMRTDGKSPSHKLYRLTDGGRGVLQTAISDLLRQPRAFGTGFELGLANLRVLTPRQIFKVLSDHRTDLNHRLEAVKTSWQRHQQDDTNGETEHIQALYTHSIALMTAELDWLVNFLADWAQKYPAVQKPETEPKGMPPVTEHSRATQLHRRTTPDPAKMIQRLRPPKTDSGKNVASDAEMNDDLREDDSNDDESDGDNDNS